MGAWNWLDWILAAVVLVSIITAAVKGLVRELISLASVIAGLIVAAFGYQRAALLYEDMTRSHEVALGLGFLTLFVGTLIVGLLLSLLARRLVKSAGLEWFDRFLGGVFGLIRGTVVDCILLMVLVAFSIKVEAVHTSFLAPFVVTGARVVALIMPGELKEQFGAGLARFRQALIEQDQKSKKN